MLRLSRPRLSVASAGSVPTASSSLSSSTPRALALLIAAVAEKRISLNAEDVFRLSATATSRDGSGAPQLGLLHNKNFVTALRDAAAAQQQSLSPFQLNQVKEMCSRAGIEFEQAVSSSSEASAATKTGVTGGGKKSSVLSPQEKGTKKKTQQHPSNLWDESTGRQSGAAAGASTTADYDENDNAGERSKGGDHRHHPYQVEPDKTGNPASLQEVMDVLFVAKNTFDERNTYDLRSVQAACDEQLLPVLHQVQHGALSYIVSVLATIHHQDYNLAQKLSRRACELANALNLPEACKMLFRLFRLRVQDSLTALVRRIEADAKNMNMWDLVNVISAAQLQHQTTAVMQPLVVKALYELSGRIGGSSSSSPSNNNKQQQQQQQQHALTIGQIIVCLDVAARFLPQQQQHGAAPATATTRAYVTAVGNRASELNDQQVAHALRCCHSMKLLTPEVFAQLSQQVIRLNDKHLMDVKYFDTILDVCSLVPFNSSQLMESVLLRLADDAGKLRDTHLVSVMELLSSYPGAKGSTAIPTLALAACLRKELLDQQGLTTVLLSLAMLSQFSDEFFLLGDFLLSERRGFKTGADLVDLLGFVLQQGEGGRGGGGVAAVLGEATERFHDFVRKAAGEMITSLSGEDTVALKEQLVRLGIDDPALARRLQGRIDGLGGAPSLRHHQPHSSSFQHQQRPPQQQEQHANRDGGKKNFPPQQQHQHQHHQQGRKQHHRHQHHRHQQNTQGGNKNKKKPFDLKKAMWDFD